MNVSMKQLLACVVLLSIGHYSVRAEYDVNAYCTLVQNGVSLASIDSCQTYYTCRNGKSQKRDCPASQSFDKDAQACRPTSDVKCYLGNERPCEREIEGFVPWAGVCNGYIYCKNYQEVNRGHCPNKQIFYQGRCVYGECNNSGGQDKELNSVCQIMPENIWFGSTVNCGTYQKCVKGELKPGDCPTGFYFDIQLQKCNYESLTDCSRVTGQDIQPDPTPTRPCGDTEEGNKYGDARKCSVFYVCKDKKWVPQTCPQGYFYSQVGATCLTRQRATPNKSCNRCEFSRKQFVNSVDPTCRGYQICDNGVLKKTSKCESEVSFFDESSQSCLLDTRGLKQYSLTNGACFNCDTQCGTLSSTNCKAVSGCNCAVVTTDKGDVCAECDGKIVEGKCTEDCDATCKNLSECAVTPTCKCGKGDNDKCVVCPGEITDGKCVDTGNTVNCADKCKTASPCQPVDNCKCGPNAQGTCVDCGAETCPVACDTTCEGLSASGCKETNGCNCAKDASNKCVDCDKTCKAASLSDCTSVPNCKCSINNGECKRCAAAADCQCACGTTNCPKSDPNCGCYSDTSTSKCIYCAKGLNGADACVE